MLHGMHAPRSHREAMGVEEEEDEEEGLAVGRAMYCKKESKVSKTKKSEHG